MRDWTLQEMKIAGTESPFLQSLLPAEKIQSWALEVELEENRECLRNAVKSTTFSTSPNWMDRGSREARNECRSEKDTWRQSRHVSKQSTRPNYSGKSLQGRDQAVDMHQSSNDKDVEMLKTTSKSCYIQCQKGRYIQTSKVRHDNWKQSRRGEHDCINQSKELSPGYPRHGQHKRAQDLNANDRSEFTRGKCFREIRYRGPLEVAAGYARQGSSRGDKVERNERLYDGVKTHADNKVMDLGSEQCKGETKTCSDRLGHGDFKGHDRMPAGAHEKSSTVQKEDQKCLLHEEFGSLESKERPKQSYIEKRFELPMNLDVDARQILPIYHGCHTTSAQVEGESGVIAEAPSKSFQGISSSFEGIMEPSLDADANAKGDAACFGTKKEYEMLASLLLEDSLDIDQDFDVTLAASGLPLPDPVYCESIFGDDLELPAVGMDIEPVAEVRSFISTKSDTTFGLVENGEKMTAHKAVSSVENLGRSHSVGKDNGAGSAGNKKGSSNLPEARPFSKVFVDVTNTFEIPDAPVKGKTEEDDAHRVNQRHRQVEFGRNTLGYERYCELVPRCKRKPKDPQTPNPKQVCSKRSWDGQIRKWRRLLHAYDPPHEHGEEEAEDFSTHRSSLQKNADPMRENTTRGFSEPKGTIQRDANLSIYNDWNEF